MSPQNQKMSPQEPGFTRMAGLNTHTPLACLF